jgi:GNAT superfamily N-acetyltransferase
VDIRILPFTLEHLERAAALLAERQRLDRIQQPNLPERYEDPVANLPIVRELLEANGAEGVVAVRDGSVAGYLIGSRDYRSPARPYAALVQPRAASIPYAGFASVAGDSNAVYHRLYASLAHQWVAKGVTRHYVTAPARGDSRETWSNLGFGQFITLAVRSTSPVEGRNGVPEANIEIRRATGNDEGIVQDLITELFRTFADPPIFLPYLEETSAERRRFISEHMADPACPYWLALLDGRVVGVQVFEEPHSPQWHQAALVTPPRALYMLFAYTAPDARGKGVGAAFVRRTMAWARETGYDSCLLNYLPASRAAGFWTGLGFRPIAEWRHRSVDERAIWASGDATPAAP